MINCRQSTLLTLQKEHGQLSIKNNVQLMAHLAICRFCRLFEHQNALINKAINKRNSHETPGLTPAEKEIMLQTIQNKIQA